MLQYSQVTLLNWQVCRCESSWLNGSTTSHSLLGHLTVWKTHSSVWFYERITCAVLATPTHPWALCSHPPPEQHTHTHTHTHTNDVHTHTPRVHDDIILCRNSDYVIMCSWHTHTHTCTHTPHMHYNTHTHNEHETYILIRITHTDTYNSQHTHTTHNIHTDTYRHIQLTTYTQTHTTNTHTHTPCVPQFHRHSMYVPWTLVRV